MKSKLLSSISGFNRYVEPFLGSGAILFHLRPSRSIISDINSELISLYRVMRDNPSELFRAMENHQINHCYDYYYELRRTNFDDAISSAARMLYLNRTCWNGLYRVNLKGEFNVPIGTKTKVISQNENFDEISSILKRSEIYNCDFEETIDLTSKGDLIFADPPYTVKHNNNGFVKYNDKIFSWADQTRLADSLHRAQSRGVQIILTNADHQSVRELYQDKFLYFSAFRHSVLSGKPEYRSATSEAVFIGNIQL